MEQITLQDIFRARQAIAAIAKPTPLLVSRRLSAQTGASVYLKLETLQETGAFKLRGAANKILSLSPEVRRRGVVTVSTGNHGRAVAYVAKKLGIPATVCLSELVPQNKIDALSELDAQVEIVGKSQDDAALRAIALQHGQGLSLIHPFDDPDIIAGQGTLGLEILYDLPEVDTVLVPLSGGGLISGVALALKSANPAIRVIGVTMELGAAMHASLQAGHPIEIEEHPSLADSLGGGIGLENRYTFHMVKQYVDDVVLLSEDDIAAGMAFAFHYHHLIPEGAGAVGIGALLSGKINPIGNNLVSVVSGGNVDLSVFTKIVEQYRDR